MERKVSTKQLKLGMYVARLDRPWLETPFLFQGFYTESSQDLAALCQFCEYIYIDDEKGVQSDQYLDDTPVGLETEQRVQVKTKFQYVGQKPLQEEISYAKQNQQVLESSIGNIMEIVHLGGKLEFAVIQPTVTNMIESIMRNPDAYLWLRKLKHTDYYLYSHAIDASVLAVVLGRHLGLDKQELHDLAVGTMFFDIGKMQLPMALLSKAGKLSDEEFRLVQKHVGYGVELLRSSPGVSECAIQIVQTHHERYNGQGYPHGLAGEQIPVFGRIAAIVDCYDAIISDRPYAKPISPHDAIVKLYEWRNIDFQEELVEEFIQCLGAYPTGTIVELNSGAVGIVFSQNRFRRLRPKVMLVLDENKQSYDSLPTIDLLQEQTYHADKPLHIIRALAKGAYGIDPAQLFIA